MHFYKSLTNILGIAGLYFCSCAFVSAADLSSEPTVIITASSEVAGTGQTAIKVIDGIADGYPGDYTREWSTNGEGVGAWIQQDWPVAYAINQVTLYDRPNTTDQVLSGILSFSDGSTEAVSSLPNAGGVLTVDFAVRIVDFVRFTVTAETGINIGLSEFRVFGDPAGNVAPNANAGPDQVVNEGVPVQLDGTASSDANDDPLTYSWTQSGGLPVVALADSSTTTPSFTSPSGLSGPTDLIFQLDVFDGLLTTSDFVTITVSSSIVPVNIAPTAVVTASSENAGVQQLSTKAVDTVIDGYPGDYTKEWATAGEAAGAWIELTWPSAYSISQVVLYDRPNTNDHIQSATLSFSDASSVVVPALVNNGGALVIDFPARVVSSVRLTVNSTSGATQNAGLAEMEVFATPAGNVAPVADAGVDQSVSEGASVQLDGAASFDPNGDTFSFAWSQTGGSTVTLTGESTQNPTFDAPASVSTSEILEFTLLVDDGLLQGTDVVEVTVNDGSTPSNLAADISASVSASSESAPNQTALKAVDEVIDGWPGDSTKEWATSGGGAGSWIEISWPITYLISEVVLFDRPNNNDQVLGGTLLFSDGSTVNVGSLPNAGAALSSTFAPKLVDSVRFTIDSVSGPTGNVGLSEIQVMGVLAGNIAPVSNAGLDQTKFEGDPVSLDGSASSDPNFDVITFAWAQTGGTAVTLVGDTTSTPTFTAPNLSSASDVLTFSLTVDDGALDNVDSVDVTVYQAGAGVPTANAGGDQIARESVTVELNGTASVNPNPTSMTYSWLQTSGPSVTLSDATSATPTFLTPSGLSSNQTLGFSLTVNNGVGQNIDTVEVTVLEGAEAPNVALVAGLSVTASAESAGTTQFATKAVDGVIDGYPGDYTAEWAAPSGGAGSWIQLNWSAAEAVNRIVLHDRPNTADQILSGTLTFSHGPSVAVSELPNDGAPLVVNFSNRSIDWVRLTIDEVSNSTGNVGLAEFQVFSACSIFPSVQLLSPVPLHFQSSDVLNVEALVCFDPVLHSGWGTRFTLDGGSAQIVSTEPVAASFTSVTKAEHTVMAEVVNSSSQVQAGVNNSDQISNIAIGDYYVAIGDSITFGTGDDIASDDGSADGRNVGAGYTPILVDLLNTNKSYPNYIANEGVPGINAIGTLNILADIIARHPQATAYLLKIGMNDSYPLLPTPSGLGLNPGDGGYPGSFKQRLQAILDALNATGNLIYVSNVNPPLSDFFYRYMVCRPFRTLTG